MVDEGGDPEEPYPYEPRRPPGSAHGGIDRLAACTWLGGGMVLISALVFTADEHHRHEMTGNPVAWLPYLVLIGGVAALGLRDRRLQMARAVLAGFAGVAGIAIAIGIGGRFFGSGWAAAAFGAGLLVLGGWDLAQGRDRRRAYVTWLVLLTVVGFLVFVAAAMAALQDMPL